MAKRYSKEALFEIFGTPSPNIITVQRWRREWIANNNNMIPVFSYNSIVKFAIKHEIDPLFYAVGAGDNGELLVARFYNEEDAVYFKLYNDMS